MAENAPPSINPADYGNLGGTMQAVMRKFLMQTDDMLPAKVISYDRAANRACVQPVIMMGTTDNRKISRAQIAAVPVLNLGGGGYVISFPIKPGDLGWIKASDRDLSFFLQSLEEDAPNTKRLHSFQDGLFIPDVMRDWTLSGADTESMVIQSTSGNVRISLGANTLMLTAPSIIVDTAVMTVTGDVVASGKSLVTHKHGGVQTGGGQTGIPV